MAQHKYLWGERYNDGSTWKRDGECLCGVQVIACSYTGEGPWRPYMIKLDEDSPFLFTAKVKTSACTAGQKSSDLIYIGTKNPHQWIWGTVYNEDGVSKKMGECACGAKLFRVTKSDGSSFNNVLYIGPTGIARHIGSNIKSLAIPSCELGKIVAANDTIAIKVEGAKHCWKGAQWKRKPGSRLLFRIRECSNCDIAKRERKSAAGGVIAAIVSLRIGHQWVAYPDTKMPPCNRPSV